MSAMHPVFFRSIVFSKEFPKTVCAPHERPIDSVGRYEKAKIAKCLQAGGLYGGGGGQ